MSHKGWGRSCFFGIGWLVAALRELSLCVAAPRNPKALGTKMRVGSTRCALFSA
jgi:hypothetical protein